MAMSGRAAMHWDSKGGAGAARNLHMARPGGARGPASRMANPPELRRVIFVWEEELSSFYIRKISYLPFRTPPLVKLAGPARGWSQTAMHGAPLGGRTVGFCACEGLSDLVFVDRVRHG